MSISNQSTGQAAASGATERSGYGPMAPWHRWQDWVNLVLGVWLFVSPWIWQSTTSAAAWTRGGWDAWIVGVVIVVLALWALAVPASAAPEWLNAIAGLWLFISPWVLSFAAASHALAWNAWIVSVIVFVLAVWAGSTVGRTTHTGGMAART